MTILFTGKTIGFMFEGEFIQADLSHPRFDDIVALVKEGRLQSASAIIDLKTAVSAAIKGSKLVLKGNSLYLGEEEIRGVLGRRIVEMMRMGFDVKPLELFVTNLLENPSKRAVDELYGFLEASMLPITDDGHFLAYKSVRSDFTDHHSGRMDNSVGTTVSMLRNKVDEDKDRTCSYGLHFAAHEYAESFGRGGKMVILKINPRDVVAIPSDYKNQKGRCCSYEVIREVERSDKGLVGSIIIGTPRPKVTARSHVTPPTPAVRGVFALGTEVTMTTKGHAEHGVSTFNPQNTKGVVVNNTGDRDFVYRVAWSNGQRNAYRTGELTAFVAPVVPYVPQSDNYNDAALWELELDYDCFDDYFTFKGEAKDFPINRETMYDLTRKDDSKVYEGYFLTSYSEKHDNLVFRKPTRSGNDFNYCTVSDVNAWAIETDEDAIVLGS